MIGKKSGRKKREDKVSSQNAQLKLALRAKKPVRGHAKRGVVADIRSITIASHWLS